MSKTYSRRDALAVIASAAAFAPPVRAADFDWKRYKDIQVRFMVSTHPWTEWAQKQLAGQEAATGIKVAWEILYEDQFRQKLPLTLRSDPGAVDGFFTLPSWDAAAFSRAKWYQPLDQFIKSDLTAPDWDYADFFPNILKIHSAGGEQVGVPITIEHGGGEASPHSEDVGRNARCRESARRSKERDRGLRHAGRRRASGIHHRSVPVRFRRPLARREGRA
jgi:ABC-type glycerol-3-phosphate transport system substrate-binding protein